MSNDRWRHVATDGRFIEGMDPVAGIWLNDDYPAHVCCFIDGAWYVRKIQHFVTPPGYDSAQAAIIAFMMLHEK